MTVLLIQENSNRLASNRFKYSFLSIIIKWVYFYTDKINVHYNHFVSAKIINLDEITKSLVRIIVSGYFLHYS